MSKIIPTITAASPADYARELEKLAFAPRLHIDITDGEFAPSQTVNLNQVYWDEGKIIDLHLMMRQPQKWLHQIVALNPALVICHAEIPQAKEILPKFREHLAKFGIKFGIAILPETSPENVREIIEIADCVLIFGGHLGFQGGTADLKNLEKIAPIRKINPHAEIAWDGGANAENISEIVQNGVQIINVGAAIAASKKPKDMYNTLTNTANQTGEL